MVQQPQSTNGSAATEAAWDEEICARVRAVEEGRVAGVAYAEVRAMLRSRLEALKSGQDAGLSFEQVFGEPEGRTTEV